MDTESQTSCVLAERFSQNIWIRLAHWHQIIVCVLGTGTAVRYLFYAELRRRFGADVSGDDILGKHFRDDSLNFDSLNVDSVKNQYLMSKDF